MGGVLLYITTHLGTAFYALLLLVFLNVIAAMWSRDVISALHKWLKVIMGTAIPFTMPMLAHSQGIGWGIQDTKTLVILVFMALLSSTVPDLLSFAKKVMTAFQVPQKDQTTLLAEAQAEIARLSAMVEQQKVTPIQQENKQ